jgi:hypothetical protein
LLCHGTFTVFAEGGLVPLKPRKKTTRAKKAIRSVRRARAAKPAAATPLSREMGVGAAALGILTLVVLIMMVAARPRATGAEPGAASRNAEASAALIDEATAAPAAPTTADAAPAADVGLVTAPVTITGCLERDDESFRLKDTEGDDAPRARSWKSGFLKKGRPPVQVVDAANRLGLSTHVGERVTVTGTLIDRELRIRSLHRVSSSCSSKTRV